MEQSSIAKSLGHAGSYNGSAMSKLAYIDREKYTSTYDCKTYDFSHMKKDDLVFSSTLKPKEIKYDNFSDILNNLENDKVTIQKKTVVARDWMFNLDNRLAVKDSNGNLNIVATKELLKPSLDNFFTEFFSSKGYPVHYVIHFPNSANENFHLHAISTAYKYDTKNDCWMKKSYRNINNDRIYVNPLDDKFQSGKALQEIREAIANIQNNKLKELGYVNDEDMVQHESYKNRGIDKFSTYHLSKYHYDELIKLKNEYSYIEDIAERNETIIKERKGKLTKRQIHNLKAEIYNSYTNSNEINKIELINKAMDKAFANKSSGYINHELSHIAKSALTNVAKSINELNQETQRAANQNQRRR